jgi:hypothetical protein
MDVPLDTPFWEVGHLTASFEANPPTFFIPWNILTNGELTSQELTLQEAVIYLNSTQPAIKWAVRTGLLPSFRPRKNQGGHRGHHFSKFDLDWYKDNIYCSPGKSKKIQIADENGNITETNLNF